MRRPALWLGGTAMLVASAATAAWLTRPPETAPPPRLSKAARARLAAAAPPPVPVVAVAVPEADPPPVPSARDFAPAAPEKPSPPTTVAAPAGPPVDWAAMPIEELRAQANTEIAGAMEELARRLLQGDGVAKDPQAGAGWMLRAAQRGSAQAAFNVGVMYERGFVVERDSSKAVEWYRKAAEANLATAKHNLALLLRDGKGAPRNGAEAADLLRAAARQGMAASMFTLGDMYERGEMGQKDLAMALAWFALASEFERQASPNNDSPLGRMASQRALALQRIMLPGEVQRARDIGEIQFNQIVEALRPPKPPEPPREPAAPPAEPDPPGWPSTSLEQVKAIQQALVDLKLLRDKPDGMAGPMTRNAIKAFQRSAGQPESGEPDRQVFAALQAALAKRDAPAAKPANGKD